jgi:23S rRNA (cytosine1962-C5)-methyltransferase
MPPAVIITARGEERVHGGHPWVYRSDVVDVRAAAGDVVLVRSARGRPLGLALFSSESQIAIRMLLRGGGEAADVDALLQRRLDAAIAFRASLAIDASAYRVIHGEADLLPSLIVDRYGDYLVVQALSQGMDRLMPAVVRLLQERLQPRGILARNDPRARLLEGLERRVDVLAGEIPATVTVRELGIDYDVDLRAGQKTGLFLDQRENRAAAMSYAHGRLLDCFSYTGGFALALGRRCREVVAYDISADAVARLGAHAARNGLAIDARVGNVFDELRGLERLGERFDTIVLDPPAFAKSKKNLETALRGYKEMNLRALKMLRPGGVLVTCSCSFHVSEAEFLGVLASAAADAHRTVKILEKRGTAKDHPAIATIPETSYLKCIICTV